MRHLVVGIAAALAVGGSAYGIEVGDAPAAIAVVDQSDLSDTTVTDIRDILANLPQVPSYRFGDDPAGAPTLDRDADPAATPDAIGAFILQPDGVGYGDLKATLKLNATYFAESGAGLTDDAPYAFFISTRQMSVQEPSVSAMYPTLYRQIDWTIGFDDAAGWVAQESYPGDTWQGASLALSAQYQPDVPLSLNLYDLNATPFAMREFDGFFAWGDDWTVAAVDYATLKDYGGVGLRYGFSSHVHDGTYGSCPTCASIVTTYPPVPRSNTDLFGFPVDEPITVTLGAPEDTSTIAIGDGDDGWDCCWCLFFGGVGGFGLGLGAWYWDARRNERPFLPGQVTRGIADRVRGRTPTPPDCEPLRVRWKSAERTRRAREKLADSAKSFLDSRVARVAELRAQRATYQKALEGPRGGTGDDDFATIDGQLIKYDDLQGLAEGIDAQIADAEQSVNDAKATVDERLADLKEAEKAEKAAQTAFDACAAGGAS